jgi:poly-gamma-glutamate synthase PgsB/CapB
MLTGFELLAIATGGLLSLGAAESTFHQRSLRKIPIRIHVAGTRGKSSVTRLLAAGLRGAGLSTAAKTTGTLPRMILPEAREVPVFRPTKANIIEQKRIVSTASALNVDALVIECMALNPKFHWISENKLIRATHGVITNVRADHLDVMGPTDGHVARCLAGMIPVNGSVFTAEARHLDIIETAAKDRGSRCISIRRKEIEAITRDELSRFRYIEHAENVALCLRILHALGIDRETALAGMWRTNPDPGALTAHTIDFFGRTIVFVNGFAANDPVSTKMIWERSVAQYQTSKEIIAVFNMRGDRPERTIQLARESDYWHSADKVILLGSGAYAFARLASQANVDSGKFVFADFDRVDEIFESIISECGHSSLVIGMGNIGGLGLPLVNYFKNRANLKEETL